MSGDEHAVVARNFPAAWTVPTEFAKLPTKVTSLLQRIGPLSATPVVIRRPHGLEAVARFLAATNVDDAVKTLHGTDLRTSAEKRAANFEAPRENERFWLQPLAIASGVGASSAAVTDLALPGAMATPVLASVAAPGEANTKKRLKPNGVHLSPLPPGWGESDVKLLATPYGTVTNVRMEQTSAGRGANIDYQKESAACNALGGLDGLSLMGVRLRCVVQEEPEPEQHLANFVIYVDELAMPSRPEAHPRLDDREVFCTQLPAQVMASADAARAWLATFGEADDVFLLKDNSLMPSGKAYVRFRSHADACRAIEAIQERSDGKYSPQAAWSESERVLQGTRGSYGLNVVNRLCGENGAELHLIRQATGVAALIVGTADRTQQGQIVGPQLHFLVQCEKHSQAEECKALLSAELAKIHVAFTHEVQASLVLRGFPASWSEKGLKFVFAPFGGLASVALEEDISRPVETGTASARLGYVKLRNVSATSKAVTSLHQTKVGDGDLVEACVVACQRWHLRAWSDGDYQLNFCIDQLAMSRRPLEVPPSATDRELFVRNLPLQDMNRQQLKEYFEGFGQVEDLILLCDPFTEEPISEGYVLFAHHRDARHCLEALALPPGHEAEATDLTGAWSESERFLQRKANCYKFNLIAELVGQNGSGLEKLKTEAKLNGLWLLANSLKQKDSHAPMCTTRHLQIAGRFVNEAQVKVFRQLLERAIESIHARISDRLERRKRKAEAAPQNDQFGGKGSAQQLGNGHGNTWQAPLGTTPWSSPPPAYWGGPTQGPPPGYEQYGRYPGAPPMGYPAPPPPGWAPPPSGPPPRLAIEAPPGDVGREERPRSRRRREKHRTEKHRSSGGGAEKDGERKHRSRSRKREGGRRRRRDGEEVPQS